jgi:hypothetical protein
MYPIGYVHHPNERVRVQSQTETPMTEMNNKVKYPIRKATPEGGPGDRESSERNHRALPLDMTPENF